MKFSPREREVLEFLVRGKRHEEIAYLLGITRETVSGYLKSARFKAAAWTTPHLVYLVVKEGIIK